MNLNINESKSKFIITLFYAFLFLSALNFYNIGIHLLVVTFFAFSFLFVKRIIFPFECLPIAFFSIAFFVFALATGSEFLYCTKVLFLGIVWILAYNIFKNKKDITFARILIVLSFGMATKGLLNFAYNAIIGTEFASGLSYDIFTKGYSSATGQATNYTLFIAASFYLIFLQKGKFLKLISLIYLILSFVHNTMIGGRSYYVFLFISYFISLLFFFVIKPEKKKARKINAGTLLLFIAIVSTVVFIFSNSSYFESIFEKTYLFRRINYGDTFNRLFSDERFNRINRYLKLMPKYLFGGLHIRIDNGVGYAHNLWFDVYDEAGLISTLFLSVYTIAMITRFLKVKQIKCFDKPLKVLSIPFIVVSILQFAVEPILLSSPIFVFSIIILDASVFCSKEKNRRGAQNENIAYFSSVTI